MTLISVVCEKNGKAELRIVQEGHAQRYQLTPDLLLTLSRQIIEAMWYGYALVPRD